MADEGNVLTDLDANAPLPNGADTFPAVSIVTQYVKDLSVENPNAPAVFQWTEQPQIDVQFNIGAEKISEEVTEIELKISLTAKTSQANAYLVELAYCGWVAMRTLPEEEAPAFPCAEAPPILFPFAPRVLADAVRDAGFPPM